MATLQGFLPPRSPEGRAALVRPPPWHYSGDLLTIEYRTDPARVAALLPDGIELAPDDPGAVALIWADWQSCSDSFDELLDPVRAQYKECFAVVRCAFRGQVYSRCVYIWVDSDFALARGWHQGYPKKLGAIHMSRPVTVGRAGPRLQAGGRFGATLSAGGRRLADARFTITGPSTSGGFVNALPMLHTRAWPSIENGAPASMHELVTMKGRDVELSPAWTGTAEMALFPSPTEELAALAPREMIGGYYRSVGVTFDGGTCITRVEAP
ncbi:acetoacetate decarboxylase family protein [Pendulispora rubella]|uniref:Acetoacetate decarboxylase family protein n=1 Tax=Pendulispora rubella TaxID=2741070 RepID=A0ABZ2L245_9BACT